ncbi:hypothetical protein [Photobacterium sp. 1_MG-2023]|uniref:hypothetical protein n=1 Tax=Photobacterium sp. 1_MG-2023 TaxID=3062646 RepID=UPI0026E297C9|nr:hypothetical protein [Photobacterium sp. 1_MG-2023]MDO6707541.1 hypothetical protein [Photobacterium sp. 1_MG-2023]
MMNQLQPMKTLLLVILRYTVYLPFLGFYSFMVGPIVGSVLMLGGVAFLSLILGPKTALAELKKAYHTPEHPVVARG